MSLSHGDHKATTKTLPLQAYKPEYHPYELGIDTVLMQEQHLHRRPWEQKSWPVSHRPKVLYLPRLHETPWE